MRKREKEETESIKTPQHTSAHVSTRHRHVESGGPGGAVRVRIASPLESRLSGSASAADAPYWPRVTLNRAQAFASSKIPEF